MATNPETYEDRKRHALLHLRHAVEQAEKDQWFNVIATLGQAVYESSGALQFLKVSNS